MSGRGLQSKDPCSSNGTTSLSLDTFSEGNRFNGALSADLFKETGIAAVSQSPHQFGNREMDGTKPRSDVHALSLYCSHSIARGEWRKTPSGRAIYSGCMKIEWDEVGFGNAVYAWLDPSQGRTIKNLAIQAGIKPTSLSNVLNGQSGLGAKTAYAIAEIIGCNPAKFVKNPPIIEYNNIDGNLLYEVIVFVENFFRKKRVMLPPEPKSRCICDIYIWALSLPRGMEPKSRNIQIEQFVWNRLTQEALCTIKQRRLDGS